MKPVDLDLLQRALEEAHDALGALRRGHGIEVTNLCYPAYNTLGEALQHLAEKGARP